MARHNGDQEEIYPMTVTITSKMLRAKRACINQVELFEKTFGPLVTFETLTDLQSACNKYADEFDWDWAATNILSKPALAEYNRATAPALAEYDRATAPARAEYDRARATARAEYTHAMALAWAEAFWNEHMEAR